MPTLLIALMLSCMPLVAAAAATSIGDGCDGPEGCAELRLDDLIQRPVGPLGLVFTPRTLALHGRLVCTQGHMVIREQAQTGRFLLSRHPLRMSEHADGEADDLPPDALTVLLPLAQQDAVPVQGETRLGLCGRLMVGREEGPDGRVSWIRLQLERPVPELAAAPAVQGERLERPTHLH